MPLDFAGPYHFPHWAIGSATSQMTLHLQIRGLAFSPASDWSLGPLTKSLVPLTLFLPLVTLASTLRPDSPPPHSQHRFSPALWHLTEMALGLTRQGTSPRVQPPPVEGPTGQQLFVPSAHGLMAPTGMGRQPGRARLLPGELTSAQATGPGWAAGTLGWV